MALSHDDQARAKWQQQWTFSAGKEEIIHYTSIVESKPQSRRRRHRQTSG